MKQARHFRTVFLSVAVMLAVPLKVIADDMQQDGSVPVVTLDVGKGAMDLNLVREDATESAVYNMTISVPGRKVDEEIRVRMGEDQSTAVLSVKVKENTPHTDSSLTTEQPIPLVPMGLGGGDPVKLTFQRSDVSAPAVYDVAIINATNGEFNVTNVLSFQKGTNLATLDISANFSRLDMAKLRISNATNAEDRLIIEVPVKRSALAALEDNFHVSFAKKIPFGTQVVSETGPDGKVTERVEQIFKPRWHYLTNGLRVTIVVAFCSVLLGALLGFLVAVVRSMHDNHGRMKLLNAVAKVYITVIRGTPMTVQLLIAYFIIFSSVNNKILVAILAFGFNSGAYVAEIIRAGIESIDRGQMEAARSLGMSYVQGMWRIVLPQAFRNVLPALGNEFIVLLKDTSIASFIGLDDLARGGSIIRSQTYQAYLPFLAVAGIYLVMVMIFSKLLGKLEHNLNKTKAK